MTLLKAYNEEGYKGNDNKHDFSICFEERSNIYDSPHFVSQMANFSSESSVIGSGSKQRYHVIEWAVESCI